MNVRTTKLQSGAESRPNREPRSRVVVAARHWISQQRLIGLSAALHVIDHLVRSTGNVLTGAERDAEDNFRRRFLQETHSTLPSFPTPTDFAAEGEISADAKWSNKEKRRSNMLHRFDQWLFGYTLCAQARPHSFPNVGQQPGTLKGHLKPGCAIDSTRHRDDGCKPLFRSGPRNTTSFLLGQD